MTFVSNPFLFTLGTCVALLSSASANWPEFRGPTQDGEAPEGANLPTTWSETENVTWKVPIHDKGWSTPVIWNDQVWLTTASEDGVHQFAICVDKLTGETRYDDELFYNREPRPLGNTRNTYASPSPTIEDGRVYVHFGSYGTACLDTNTGETIWRRTDLPCHHWRGPASSPIIYGGLLILTYDGADFQYVAALDKATGETVWRTERSTEFGDIQPDGSIAADGDWRKAYNTPVLIDFDGTTHLISPGAKATWALNPNDGSEIWSLHYDEHSSASRPVFDHDLGLMFINTGYGKSKVLAVELDAEATGEISESHVVWEEPKRMPNRCSPILHDGRYYVISDQGVATSLDAKTGEEIWSERISEIPFSASILLSGDLLYFFDEGGKGIVIRAADEFEIVAENTLDEGMFSSPAVDGDSLYLRTVSHLYRIDTKAQ